MARSVIIFKALETEGHVDIYEQKFKEAGISVIIIPPIEFEFCNLDTLTKKLNDPDSYSGIIFTSPRAVKAVSLSLHEQESLLPEWHSSSIFVVGESTSRCLVDQLGLRSEGEESGSARELGDQIAKIFSKALLFPCGNLKTDVLPQTLTEKGISVEEVTVYRTCPHPSLADNLCTAIKKRIPDCIIFFSPSGVKHTIPLMKSIMAPLENIKFVCIGPSTAAALQEHGVHIWATAKKPNPCSLLEAVIQIKNM
ncbi:uroporphyrinogen-III synthase-like isoform X2 [Hetaerina americana]|uniref:uroporphyrinogen-III synthase-like isoform X2 n=1 Tax=Hetaerina americana TaxID=62018 RepID=UPI003A7F3D4E